MRRLLGEALTGGDPGLENFTRQLGMTARTLQRKLKEEGTSYQDLIDEVRCEVARRHLRRPAMAISEIAFALGFSETSAFHRAFKRWTGMTPKEYRHKIG